jgi:hypothetical protein
MFRASPGSTLVRGFVPVAKTAGTAAPFAAAADDLHGQKRLSSRAVADELDTMTRGGESDTRYFELPPASRLGHAACGK